MACIAERQMCVLDQYNEVNVNELVDEGFFVVVPGDSLVLITLLFTGTQWGRSLCGRGTQSGGGQRL